MNKDKTIEDNLMTEHLKLVLKTHTDAVLDLSELSPQQQVKAVVDAVKAHYE